MKYGKVKEGKKVLGKVKKFIYVSKDELGNNVIPAPLFWLCLKFP